MSLKLNAVRGQRPKVLIPDNTVVKILMRIRKGQYDDPSRGWTGGYATLKKETGVVYLHCMGFILEGEYARQSIHFFIGLESPNSEEYQENGLNFIRSIVDSAHGFSLDDESPEAVKVREGYDIPHLDGLEFTALVNTEINLKDGRDMNVVRYALTVDDDRYLGKTISGKTPSLKK